MKIVLEGLDGSGKTTLAKIISIRLGYQYIKFPTVYIPDEDAMSFYKDILMNPIHERCVADRYIYSTIAYGVARGVDYNVLKRRVLKGINKPDFAIFIDIPVELSLERKNEYNKEFLTKVKETYLMMLGECDRMYIVDGTQDIETVLDDIYDIISREMTFIEKLKWRFSRWKYLVRNS